MKGIVKKTRTTYHHGNLRTALIDGATHFLTMAYILVVNPNVLGAAGMARAGVLAATALGAALATLAMAQRRASGRRSRRTSRRRGLRTK